MVSGRTGFELCKLFAADELAFDCQSTTPVIAQQDSLLADLFLEGGIVGAKVLNGFLLLSIDPAGKNDQHQLPRLQNEFHQRLGMTRFESIIGVGRIVNLRDQSCEESKLGGVPVRTIAETLSASTALRSD